MAKQQTRYYPDSGSQCACRLYDNRRIDAAGHAASHAMVAAHNRC